MKNLESNHEKNIGATSKSATTIVLRMLVSATIVSLFSLSNIIIPSLFSLSNIIIPDIAPQLVRAEETQPGVNSVEEISFSSPLNNSYNLGTPFLIEYDNTTSLKPIKNVSSMSFDLTFEGYGTVNGIKYKDNGTGIFLTNPTDGSVYQKGIIELRTNSDAIETTYESISRKHNNGIVLDNGIMIFNASSSTGGELSFLNNTVAAYKDMIDLRRGNLTTIAWEWK
jgi:hypothetical protein